MTDKRYSVLVVGLVLAAVWQMTASAPATGEGLDRPYVVPPVGKVPDNLVTEADTTLPVAALGKGACTFLVVYSESCPASRDAAARWARARPSEENMPRDWEFVWVSVESSRSLSTDFFPPTFNTRRAQFAGGEPLSVALGVNAYPATMTLDRSGAVVGGTVGAVWPTLGELTTSCGYQRSGGTAAGPLRDVSVP